MKKFWLQVATLSAIILFFMALGFNQQFRDYFFPQIAQPVPLKQGQLNIANKVQLRVEIADDRSKRTTGLGGRESLATDSGMLFVFDNPSKHRFWMKGLKFPLDFIWISGDRVVDLLPNIPPPEANTADENLPAYGPVVPVDKVLEVNAGFVAGFNIRVGDKIELIR